LNDSCLAPCFFSTRSPIGGNVGLGSVESGTTLPFLDLGDVRVGDSIFSDLAFDLDAR
jgi:hypothetical protein